MWMSAGRLLFQRPGKYTGPLCSSRHGFRNRSPCLVVVNDLSHQPSPGGTEALRSGLGGPSRSGCHFLPGSIVLAPGDMASSSWWVAMTVANLDGLQLCQSPPIAGLLAPPAEDAVGSHQGAPYDKLHTPQGGLLPPPPVSSGGHDPPLTFKQREVSDNTTPRRGGSRGYHIPILAYWRGTQGFCPPPSTCPSRRSGLPCPLHSTLGWLGLPTSAGDSGVCTSRLHTQSQPTPPSSQGGTPP